MIGEDYIAEKVQADLYPQGEEASRQIRRRRVSGSVGRYVFIGATALAVLLLIILLVKIVNDSMGLVAQESRVPERELVLAFNEDRVMSAPNILLATEDDLAIAAAVAEDVNGLGFLPWNAYLTQADSLNLVAVDGHLPSPAAVASEEYPLARPLYLYSAKRVIDAKPQVGAFLAFYLQHLDEVVTAAGYFPANPEIMAQQAAVIAEVLGVAALPIINPADFEGDIVISGSSTVAPLTEAMAALFKEGGFPGTIIVNSVGTTSGFEAFCRDNDPSIDIVSAGRPVLATEYAACASNQRRPVEINVAQDALSVIVNRQNSFTSDVTKEDLTELFTSATVWADVNAAWPTTAINRYIPSAASGTMDFFVEQTFAAQSLSDMPYEALVSTYVANVSKGRCRAVERDQRFYADQLMCEDPQVFAAVCASDNPPAGCALDPRNEAQMVKLIGADVVKPKVVASWNAITSILNRDNILAESALKYPHAEVIWKRWLTWDFVTSPQSSYPETAGIRTAILGTLWVVGIAIAFSFPLGVGAAVYLEEYADKMSRFNQIVQTNINNLAGVPSIIYGLLGLAVFVRALEPLTSGALFGAVDPGASANGRTILSAGLTLGLLGLPVIIISAQEAIRAVPGSLRQASMGLGATKWQTIRSHVLPNAIGGILTGVILSMSRIIGETAPLVVIGASTFITTDPTGPFSKFTTLPSQIYQWTARPQDAYRDIAAATIIVLLLLLFLLNATAIYFRNRFSKRMG